MKLREFYTPENATRALGCYTDEYANGAWALSEKVRLHVAARRAFDASIPESERRDAFHSIYDSLRRYWQVFRGSPAYWAEDVAFEQMTEIAGDVGRDTDWSLSFADDADDHSRLVDGVDRARSIKTTRSSWGSTMAMSKFLHFVNPALFPIYDNGVVEKKVLHTFRDEWTTFVPEVRPRRMPLHLGVVYYLKYLMFAADCMRPNLTGLMDVFFEWVSAQVSVEGLGETVGEEWRDYQAAAFEIIAIGADACVRRPG